MHPDVTQEDADTAACIEAARYSAAIDRSVFTELNPSLAAETEASAARRKAGRPRGPLEGRAISVKDLFDIAGSVTRAGSLLLSGCPPAEADADAVQALRSAGAVIVGKTNMTEFAYSGLGLNPHYGTPANPRFADERRIPGGSTSGGAVSVAIGAAWAALGTDTGGSLRIPAALCGLVGWKPTARRISAAGALPLSRSLDTMGPIARSVADCATLDRVLSRTPQAPPPRALAGLRLAVPTQVVLEGMDPIVSAAFDRSLRILRDAGAHIQQMPMDTLRRVVESGASPLIVASEAFAWHRDLLASRRAEYDPRVAVRIEVGASQSAADYIQALETRRRLIAELTASLDGSDAWLMPTAPTIAPLLADCASGDGYMTQNRLMLRNPSLVNFLDGCALSIPNHLPGDAPTGLSVVGAGLQDDDILAIGGAIETALAD